MIPLSLKKPPAPFNLRACNDLSVAEINKLVKYYFSISLPPNSSASNSLFSDQNFWLCYFETEKIHGAEESFEKIEIEYLMREMRRNEVVPCDGLDLMHFILSYPRESSDKIIISLGSRIVTDGCENYPFTGGESGYFSHTGIISENELCRGLKDCYHFLAKKI